MHIYVCTICEKTWFPQKKQPEVCIYNLLYTKYTSILHGWVLQASNWSVVVKQFLQPVVIIIVTGTIHVKNKMHKPKMCTLEDPNILPNFSPIEPWSRENNIAV